MVPGCGDMMTTPVGKIYRLLDIVGHQHDCCSLSLPNMQDFLLHAHSSQSVQRCEGFVQQQDLGTPHQCSCYGHSLGHAARELVRIFVFELIQPNQANVVSNVFAALFGRSTCKSKTDVVMHRKS